MWLNSLCILRLLNISSIFLLFIFTSCKEDNKDGDVPIAASIDGENILLSELDLTIQNELYETLFGVYYMRRIALEELIAEKLLQKEAKIRNISKEQLLDVEVRAKKTQAGLEKFITDNHLENGIPDKDNPLRLISIETEEGRRYLQEAYEKKILENFVESLKVKHDISTYLETPSPPKLDLASLMAHSRGSNNPLFTVWVASDFNCSECQKYHGMFESLYKKYSNRIRFNFTHLSSETTLSSVVAESCAEQDRFWEMHDLIFLNTPRDTVDFLNLAERIDVDKNRLLQRLHNSSDIQNRIGRNISQLSALNVNVTPSLIVDGTLYYGEFSLERISEYFDETISRKQKKD